MLRRTLAVALLLMLAKPAAAQPTAAGDPELDIIPEVITVFNDGGGPAWWKVTKGDSTVFILGLPPSKTLPGLKWDRTTLKRRLKGARFLLSPYTEWSGFNYDLVEPPELPVEQAKKVKAAFKRLGKPLKPNARVRVDTAMHIRYVYYTDNKLANRVQDQILAEARSVRVPIVTPPVHRHYWTAEQVAPEKPEVAACFDEIIKESEGPMKPIMEASGYWAVGDVSKALAAAPRGYAYLCSTFWPGHWERTIGFQTNAIAQALGRSGKVVAIAHISHLAARNGILERLRAQGYTVSDPAKPLTD